MFLIFFKKSQIRCTLLPIYVPGTGRVAGRWPPADRRLTLEQLAAALQVGAAAADRSQN